MNTEQQINLKFLVRFGENSYWSSQVVSRSLWSWYNVKISGVCVAQEVLRRKRGCWSWFQERRSSTSRTSENVQPVTEKICSDRRFTVLMITKEYWTWICSVGDHHGRSRIKSWLLHHDNAPSHSSLVIWEFLAKNNIAMLEQPPYSLDLDPVIFISSPNSRRALKGTHFKDSTTIKRVETKELRAIQEESSQEWMKARRRRMQKCIRSQGD